MGKVYYKKSHRSYCFDYINPDKKKQTFYLGKGCDLGTAERIRTLVENLVIARIYGNAPSPNDQRQIKEMSLPLRQKLLKAGLIDSYFVNSSESLLEFTNEFLQSLKWQKEATVIKYRQLIKDMLLFFGENTRVSSVTVARAKDFRVWLATERPPKLLSESTIRRCVGVCRTIFHRGIERKIIDSNPFSAVKAGEVVNPKRQEYISIEEMGRCLEVVRNPELRFIVALARYAGLRIPCEIREMRVNDIYEKEGHLFIHVDKSGKTGEREVPVFPELLPEWERYKKKLEHKQTFMFPRYRNCKNIGTLFKKNLKKAGLKPWQKIFNNLRSSCITDKNRIIRNPKLLNAIFGNSEHIRYQHYEQITNEDWNTVFNADQKPAPVTTTKMTGENDRGVGFGLFEILLQMGIKPEQIDEALNNSLDFMIENYKHQSKEAVDFFERYKRLEDDVIRENIRTSGVCLENSSYMESQRKLANSFHEIMEVMSKLPKF